MTRLLAAIGACAVIGCAHADERPPAEPKPVVQQLPNEARPLLTGDAEALADFNNRLKQYSELHKRLEASLPRLPKETTPTEIDTHQRALEKLIRAERRNARPGDLITQPIRHMIRQLFARVFAGPKGAELKATILDENPGPIALAVNGRYPDQVPLSTVPPQVLSSLPKLPEELEYRFIGERLILLDVHAHVIADYMENAFPR